VEYLEFHDTFLQFIQNDKENTDDVFLYYVLLVEQSHDYWIFIKRSQYLQGLLIIFQSDNSQK